MHQHFGRKIGFALLALMLACTLLEGAAQVGRRHRPQAFVPQFHGTYLFPDDRLLWKMLPGEYMQNGVIIRINSLGMRGPEPQRPKPPGARRILFLGDSSVYGDGVVEADAFPFRTAELISRSGQGPVEAANGALPGYSSTQCRIFFEDHAADLTPDAVVLAAIWSDAMGRALTDAELYSRYHSLGYRFTGQTRSLFRRSDFFTWLELAIESRKKLPESRIIDWPSIVYGDHASENSRVSVEDHAGNLETIARQCREKKIEIYFLILPYEGDLIHHVPPKIEAYRGNFHRIAEKMAIDLIDMPAIFQKYGAQDVSRLFIDGLHPTPEGHGLIADALAAAMKK